MAERRPSFRARLKRVVGCAAFTLALTGCSSLERGPAVPSTLSDQVTVVGIPNGRFWPDTQGAALVQEAADR